MDNRDAFVLLVQTHALTRQIDEVAWHLSLQPAERAAADRKVEGGDVVNAVAAALKVEYNFERARDIPQMALEFVEYALAKEDERECKKPTWL